MLRQHKVKRFLQLFTAVSAVLGVSYAQDDSPTQYVASPTLSIVTDPISQNQIYISVDQKQKGNGLSSFFLESYAPALGVSSNSMSAAGKTYLTSFSKSVQVDGVREDFVEKTQRLFADGSHFVSYKQHKNGIPVYGAEVKVHFNESGKLTYINGAGNSMEAEVKTSSITKDQAFALAERAVSAQTLMYQLTDAEKKMLGYEGPEAELVYYPNGERLELCWVVKLRPSFTDEYRTIVSAESGTPLVCHSLICRADGHVLSTGSVSLSGREKEVALYRQGNRFYLMDTGQDMFDESSSNPLNTQKGVIVTYDAQQGIGGEPGQEEYTERGELLYKVSPQLDFSSNDIVQQSAVSAQVNAAKWYNKIKSLRNGFNSWDNEGGTIRMYVNVHDHNAGSGTPLGLDNAYWAGNGVVVFGAGNGPNRLFASPTSKGLDLVAHELTHGIIESGPNLGYDSPQTLALKEALSDIVASIVDGNYDFGENSDVSRPQGYLRSAKTPHAGTKGATYRESYSNNYTANHMREYVHESNALYYNSTIISRAYYLIAGEGENDGIGATPAAEILMATLWKLSESADFYEFRNVFYAEANAYLGSEVAGIAVIREAFAKVGLPLEEVRFDNLPTINGDNFVFCNANMSPTSDILLFKKEESSSDLSFTEDDVFNKYITLKHSVSVTDEGDCIYGIDKNHHIVKVAYSTDNNYSPSPEVLSLPHGDRISEVAISKKNKRLAYTSVGNDPTIYVLDRENEDSQSFPLDTTIIVEKSNKFYTGEILRVGKMEWDFEGGRIIFEFESAFFNGKGDTLGKVWNIGEIEVWDVDNGVFKDGEITLPLRKIFHYNDLRNPSFAKNTTTIIIYDLYNRKESINSIIAWDRTPGRVTSQTVYQGKILAHPSYSNTDKQIILSDLTASGDTSLFLIDLNEDKISRSSADKIRIIGNAWNPVWFTVGVRSTSIEPTPESPSPVGKAHFYPNPTTDYLVSSLTEGSGRIKVYSMLGAVLIDIPYTAGQRINTSALEKGNYVVELTTEKSRAVSVVTKE